MKRLVVDQVRHPFGKRKKDERDCPSRVAYLVKVPAQCVRCGDDVMIGYGAKQHAERKGNGPCCHDCKSRRISGGAKLAWEKRKQQYCPNGGDYRGGDD